MTWTQRDPVSVDRWSRSGSESQSRRGRTRSSSAVRLVIDPGAAAPGILAADITGDGATCQYGIHAKWPDAYKAGRRNNLNYQAFRFGGRSRQFQNKAVGLGASDKRLKPEELEN